MLISAAVSGPRVTAAVALADGTRTELSWKLPHDAGEVAGDAMLAAALPLAMRLGEPLELAEPVSGRMLGAVAAIQDVLACWGAQEGLEQAAPPLFERVRLTAPAATRRARPDGVAAFFTGGVDSFFTVLRHREELTALVYVHGFDVGLDAVPLRDTVSAGLRAAAAELGLPLVEVEADVRAVSDRYLSWDDYHGAALATVAHLLADRFHRVYIPATMTYATLLPLGSHPVLDPLWSSERLEIVHSGAAATRPEKLAAIAGCAAARRWLRVCWENRDGAYNCGTCEKCLRTAVALRLAGVADGFDSMPALDLRAVADVALVHGGLGWREALALAERQARDPALAGALRSALHGRRNVPGEHDRERRMVSDSRGDALATLALAAELAIERDRLAASVTALEARLGALQSTRAWRAAGVFWRLRDRVLG